MTLEKAKDISELVQTCNGLSDSGVSAIRYFAQGMLMAQQTYDEEGSKATNDNDKRI